MSINCAGHDTVCGMFYESGKGYWMRGFTAMTIRCESQNRPSRPCNIVCYENHATDARILCTDVAPTAGGTWNGCYGNNNPLVLLGISTIDSHSARWLDGSYTAQTITTRTMSQYMPDKDNFGAVIQHL